MKPRKTIFSALILVVCALLSGCSRSEYRSDEIRIVSEGYTVDGIALGFVAPPEPLYHCPGLHLKYDGEKVHFTFVRSRIGESRPVDIKAESRNEGAIAIIPFPPDSDSIELIDSAGKSLGRWQSQPTNQPE